MSRRILIYSSIMCFCYILFCILIVNAGSIVSIPIVWDHDNPETVGWYNIYISETQGSYPDKPYRRVSRLPTNPSPFYLILDVDTKTIYLKVKAENENGESDWSNEIKIDMSFIVMYLD